MAERRLTVCLPARNEELHLPGLLRRLSARSGCAEYEIAGILVCANGCTDRTEGIVADWSSRDPRIRLTTSPPGKPHAFNLLLRSATTDLLLFLDCDVTPTAATIPRLLETLDRSPRAAVIAGADRPRGGSPLTRLIATPLWYDYLCGRCYLVHRPRLIERLAACGYLEDGVATMPADLLGEDFWLWGLCLPDAIAHAPAARVWTHPARLRDRVTILARDRVARRQLAAEHPALSARLDAQRTVARQFDRLVSAATKQSPADALQSLLGLVLRRALRVICAGRIHRLERHLMQQGTRTGFAEVLGTIGRARAD
jgi:glycosyltransferase involved in cell wall biosynthesis